MKTRPIKEAKRELRDATVRDFMGGWNVLDDDLNLSTTFSVKSINIGVLADGTESVRYGTRLLAKAPLYLSSPATLINHTYFSAAIVAVFSNGDILRILGDGTITRIWDAAVAAALPGSPAGWSSGFTFASFTDFNGNLIVGNGVDKPLTINADHDVDYLQDLATLTNINTPVGRYVLKVGDYLIVAGDPTEPNLIHVSAAMAPGTFVGDPAPNDATTIDVADALPEASYIRGIGEFRGKLIVAFAEGTVVYELGGYDDGSPPAHIPRKSDAIAAYGSVSHRTMISYGDDVLLMDSIGVPSLKRTVLTGSLKPERVSDLIDPDMRVRINALGFTSLEDRTFAVFNQREGQFFFFIPNTDDLLTTTETKCYVFLYRPNLKMAAWSRYDGWNFVSACRTSEGNVVFGTSDGSFYTYGSQFDENFIDFLDDPAINGGDGQGITFDWELPWSEVGRRAIAKLSKYISMDTRGTAEFTAKMYVDRLLVDGLGADAPLLTVEFTGGDSGGFGGGGPFGGGINTSFERLVDWPAKFKLMKLRFTGTVTEKLKFVSITLWYLRGNGNL